MTRSARVGLIAFVFLVSSLAHAARVSVSPNDNNHLQSREVSDWKRSDSSHEVHQLDVAGHIVNGRDDTAPEVELSRRDKAVLLNRRTDADPNVETRNADSKLSNSGEGGLPSRRGLHIDQEGRNLAGGSSSVRREYYKPKAKQPPWHHGDRRLKNRNDAPGPIKGPPATFPRPPPRKSPPLSPRDSDSDLESRDMATGSNVMPRSGGDSVKVARFSGPGKAPGDTEESRTHDRRHNPEGAPSPRNFQPSPRDSLEMASGGNVLPRSASQEY